MEVIAIILGSHLLVAGWTAIGSYIYFQRKKLKLREAELKMQRDGLNALNKEVRSHVSNKVELVNNSFNKLSNESSNTPSNMIGL
jgi:hypothetical protein